ncbi:Uncharacterized protein Fot_08396 [Forsythia ovata]|uniref:NYN domain-containing protein n=1 Tax=Forsythia ovata TaxID=205694 RepID=A0ABD1WZ12_9LAMI
MESKQDKDNWRMRPCTGRRKIGDVPQSEYRKVQRLGTRELRQCCREWVETSAKIKKCSEEVAAVSYEMDLSTLFASFTLKPNSSSSASECSDGLSQSRQRWSSPAMFSDFSFSRSLSPTGRVSKARRLEREEWLLMALRWRKRQKKPVASEFGEVRNLRWKWASTAFDDLGECSRIVISGDEDYLLVALNRRFANVLRSAIDEG